jgi:hypothetical protein
MLDLELHKLLQLLGLDGVESQYLNFASTGFSESKGLSE